MCKRVLRDLRAETRAGVNSSRGTSKWRQAVEEVAARTGDGLMDESGQCGFQRAGLECEVDGRMPSSN